MHMRKYALAAITTALIATGCTEPYSIQKPYSENSKLTPLSKSTPVSRPTSITIPTPSSYSRQKTSPTPEPIRYFIGYVNCRHIEGSKRGNTARGNMERIKETGWEELGFGDFSGYDVFALGDGNVIYRLHLITPLSVDDSTARRIKKIDAVMQKGLCPK